MDRAGRRVRGVLGDAVDRGAEAIGGGALAVMMASVRALWPIAPETPGAWPIAGVLAAAAYLALRRRSGRARSWLALAGLSILLAAMFWAANQGLDLIKPAGSRRHDIAATVAGFELWTLLCPGLTIVALAGFARALVLRSHRR